MTEAHLNRVNGRWEQFFREKKWILDTYTFGDEDLVSIGLLSVRRTLCQYPDCPDSWLVRRAKFDMLSAIRWGESLDASKRDYQRRDAPKDDDAKREMRYRDQIEFEAFLYACRHPETIVIDQLQFQALINDLDEMEIKLLRILKEETPEKDRYRYWNGKYNPLGQREKGRAKKRFCQEVSSRVKDYTISFATLRFKFFKHFGTDEEIERERQWYDNFDPFGRLHVNRGGHYDRKSTS